MDAFLKNYDNCECTISSFQNNTIESGTDGMGIRLILLLTQKHESEANHSQHLYI
jgi:hypothetical protein